MAPSLSDKGSRPQTSSSSNSKAREVFERRVEIWVHDEQFSKEDVVLNLDVFPHDRVKAGDLMAIIGLRSDVAKQQGVDFAARKIAESLSGSLQPYSTTNDRKSSEDSNSVDSRRDLDLDRRYLFAVKDMTPEMKSKYPNLEISVAKHIGDAFNFKRHGGVFLTTVSVVLQPNLFQKTDL
jgi:DEP domain-containing protein 5